MGTLFQKLLRPALFRLDAEFVHESTISAMRSGIGLTLTRGLFGAKHQFDECLKINVFGLDFKSPIGLAAGFDKNGVLVSQMEALGFGFVEVGTVTPKPQPGNPKPRLFRLPDDGAILNRMGFNNDGAGALVGNLVGRNKDFVVGINIGKNKEVPNEDAVEDYLECFKLVNDFADYVVLNVSSPNTPGLRDLQHRNELAALLMAVSTARNESRPGLPLLLKISPDVDDETLENIVEVSIDAGVSGLIVSNTTISRANLKSDQSFVAKMGGGGISGRPLLSRSTEMLSRAYRLTNGKLPLVGVGGVFDGGDAFEKILAGASLVQTYTGFIYGGPSMPITAARELAELLKKNGFSNASEAVGARVP
ncbi:MAG: quinone-dependent dihydroorotate dehydrogenase [Pyrinomonadaceae bacterium]